MPDSVFKLILALVETYLATKLGVEPLALNQTLSSEKHAQWTADGSNDIVEGQIIVTAIQILGNAVIVNFISGAKVRAVQISLSALGVDLKQGESGKVTPELTAKFAEIVDSKLLEESGFLKTPKKVVVEKNDEKSYPKNAQNAPSPELPTAPLKVTSQTRSRPLDMPDFEDEYELKDRRNHVSEPGVFNIGDRDLNPPGLLRDPPMKPYYDPLSGGVAAGGMYPTPDHPMFGQHQGNTSRLGVPPGARFDDPYGEDNLESMGMGLPGNLRGPGFGGPPSGGSPFGGGFGGPSFGGF